MDFREATDRVCRAATHEDVAKALGVSVATVRQARLDRDASGFRQPPEHWQRQLAAFAEKKGVELLELARELDAE